MLQKEWVLEATGGAPSPLKWLAYLLMRGPSLVWEESPQRRHILRWCLPSLCNNTWNQCRLAAKVWKGGGTADKDRPSTDSTIWAPDLKGCYSCRAALLIQPKSSFFPVTTSEDHISYQLVKVRLWRVPATRPDPNFYFATRTRPELLLKSSEFRVFPNRLFPSRLLQIF